MRTFNRAATFLLVLTYTAGPTSLAAVAADKQIVQAPATSPDAATGTVSGVVKDGTGVPQGGVTITAKGPVTRSVTTDSNGLYTLTLPAGIYSLVASKSGFDQASLIDYAIVAGGSATANVTLTAITFDSLKQIGRVSVSSNSSAFNTSAAAVSIISNQAFADQGQIQVQRLLDQTPGIVSDHPGTSANDASPGAITFPSIRGGLGFETSSLIDGHPLSVQTFGDYVTTFLNSYVLQDIEVIKGPGASAPETFYAINGTVNFRTLDPTATLTGQVDEGLDSEGGQFSNYRISDTINRKLGFVFDYAVDGTPGPLKDARGYSTLGSAWSINGLNQSGFTTNAASPANPQIINNPFNQASAVFCCDTVNTDYDSKTELAKIRYRFSDATSATVSYLGSQTYTDQNGNHVYTIGDTFVPSAALPYTASAPAAGQTLTVYQNTYPLGYFEINNEPIFQGEVKTTLGSDTILGRYYTASINRLQYQASGNPDASYSFPAQVYGTTTLVNSAGTKVPTVFNGQTETVTLPPSNAYYEASEEDKLHGGSIEYDHFLPSNGDVLTFSFDQTNANTDSYSFSGNPPGTGGAFVPPTESFSIYGGSNVRYTTYLARGNFNFGDKLNVTLANYYDDYSQRFTNNGAKSFITTTDGRYDGRLALTYRDSPDISLRASTGSSLAPPYLALLNSGPPVYSLSSTGTYATDSQNQGTVKAETAFGYDVGADFRLGGDKQTIVSTDLYLTNLRNQFVSGAVFQNGTVTLCPGSSKLPPCTAGVTAVTVPLFTTTSLNLDDARYEGIELSLHRDPRAGFGFTTQGALLRGYPYDVSPCTYSKTAITGGAGVNCSVANTNLGIVSGANFYGSGTSGSNGNSANGAGSNFNSVNNHAIPYAQGYGEIHYRTQNGGLVELGLQYLGPNNSFNVPAFFIGDASIRFPFPNQYSFQVSADNLFNAYGGSTIGEDGGVGVPLVNGQTGLTNANVVGPRLIRFIVEKKFGGH